VNEEGQTGTNEQDAIERLHSVLAEEVARLEPEAVQLLRDLIRTPSVSSSSSAQPSFPVARLPTSLGTRSVPTMV